MEKIISELSDERTAFGWKEKWQEPIGIDASETIIEFVTKNQLWHDWHLKIYQNKQTITAEEMERMQKEIGIDFRSQLKKK